MRQVLKLDVSYFVLWWIKCNEVTYIRADKRIHFGKLLKTTSQMRFLTFFLLVFSIKLFSQTIGTFNSVTPTAQTEQFVIPASHRFQKLMKTGDPLSAGGNMLDNPDFSCYVPIAGSSTNGYVNINHETAPGGATVLDVNYNNMTKLWSISHSQAADLAAINGLTAANCSGGLTPWGTVLSGEEYVYTSDFNADGYNDIGWIVEFDPVTRKAIRKLWALGCVAHENAAVKSDGTTIYFGADNNDFGYVYKFVCTTANDPTSGTLYALQVTGGGNGTWLVIPNTTQSDRNNTVSLSTTAGATNISRIEDVEIGPDGKIYVASTSNKEIYRFRDNGTTVSNYETYVSNQCYTVNGVCENYGYPGEAGNDNLAFDGEGNLWILNDGSGNHIWVVGASHTPGGTNDVRLFATTPAGCEPTGITFSPDYKFMFISIQHPNSGNTASQIDAAGNPIVFNKGTTLVVARQEFLGSPIIAIDIQDFTGRIVNKNQIELSWLIQNQNDIEKITIERSNDGLNFVKIGEQAPPQYKASFFDINPSLSKNYYRLKFREWNGKESFSKIINFALNQELPTIKVAENPFSNETTVYFSNLKKQGKCVIFDVMGKAVWTKNIWDTEGSFSVGHSLPSGVYFLKIDNLSEMIKIVKTP